MEFVYNFLGVSPLNELLYTSDAREVFHRKNAFRRKPLEGLLQRKILLEGHDL